MFRKSLAKLCVAAAACAFLFSVAPQQAAAQPGLIVACAGPAAAHNPHCIGGGSKKGLFGGGSAGRVVGATLLGMGLCATFSPPIHTLIKGSELSLKEAHGDVVGCFLPIIGPWLLAQHYDRMCKQGISMYCDSRGGARATRLASRGGAPVYAAATTKENRKMQTAYTVQPYEALPAKKLTGKMKSKQRYVQVAFNTQTAFQNW